MQTYTLKYLQSKAFRLLLVELVVNSDNILAELGKLGRRYPRIKNPIFLLANSAFYSITENVQ